MSQQETYHPQSWKDFYSLKERANPQGLLLLITGPTGVGKDTVLHSLTISHQRIVTYTTRPKGEFEIHGKDYYFVTPDHFKNMIEGDNFLEWIQNPRGDYYGTTRAEIMSKRASGLTVWRLNPDGMIDLIDNPQKRSIIEPAIIICLLAPLSVTAGRVRTRGREKGYPVVDRAKQAHDEIEILTRRFGPIGDERIIFYCGSWMDDTESPIKSRLALRLVENRDGLNDLDGLPRTMRLIEETITKIAGYWQLKI